jgi:hypothetical protein
MDQTKPEHDERQDLPLDPRPISDQLNEIALRCASQQRPSEMTDDEILGYDEFGCPTL